MKIFILILLSMLFFSTPALSGKMRKCKDAEGNITFTQAACPDNTTHRQNIYVAPAQAPYQGLKLRETNDLESAKQRNYKESQEAEQEYAQQRLRDQQEEDNQKNEERKQARINEIEEYMRRGKISNRSGHELITDILATGTRSENLNQSQIKQIERDMRRGKISARNGLESINDIRDGRRHKERDPDFYPRSGNLFINPDSGEAYPDVGGGFIHPQTNEFIPGGPTGAFNPN